MKNQGNRRRWGVGLWYAALGAAAVAFAAAACGHFGLDGAYWLRAGPAVSGWHSSLTGLAVAGPAAEHNFYEYFIYRGMVATAAVAAALALLLGGGAGWLLRQWPRTGRLVFGNWWLLPLLLSLPVLHAGGLVYHALSAPTALFRTDDALTQSVRCRRYVAAARFGGDSRLAAQRTRVQRGTE